MANISAIKLPDNTTYDIKDNVSGYITGMTILSYGTSTWNDFLTAYSANKVVYCRASSNSNPASGSQTRLAFMAYVNNADNPTNVEFQYYRSVSSHTASQQGDQVYVYKLDKTAGWTVTTREASVKIEINTDNEGIETAYSSGTVSIGHVNLVTAQTTQAVYPITIDKNGHIASYGSAVSIPTKTSDLTNDSGFVTTDEKVKTINAGNNTNYYLVMGSLTGTETKMASMGLCYKANSSDHISTLTIGYPMASGHLTGNIVLAKDNNYNTTIVPSTTGTHNTLTLPTSTGTLALTSDIPPIPLIPTDLSDLNNDLNVSDFPNDAGYITGYTETDPIFVASAAYGISSSDISTWNGKSDFSGNYNDLTNKPTIPTVPTNISAFVNDSGYITGYTETDPVFSASAASGISSSDISNWDSKSDFSGDYNDLTNKPTIPTDTADLTNGADFISASDIDFDDAWKDTNSGYTVSNLSIGGSTYLGQSIDLGVIGVKYPIFNGFDINGSGTARIHTLGHYLYQENGHWFAYIKMRNDNTSAINSFSVTAYIAWI